MSEFPPRPNARVIPIAGPIAATPSAAPFSPAGANIWPLPAPASPWPVGASPLDVLSRPLRDLRISVTDRCNFRCGYCMPREAFGSDHPFLPHAALLSFEEITRTARIFLSLGVRKLRLTGGEPLLRKNLEGLISQLSVLRTLDGTPPDITLTTNGTLLARKARSLKDAGLQRVTVSLDALDEARFRQMSDADVAVRDVLEGIEAAQAAGLGPVKVNMVVQRGVNDDQILPMARHFRGANIALRFIEFMDVGNTNRWDMAHVLPSQDVRALIHAKYPLQPVSREQAGDTAERWAYADGLGEVGFISSVTQAFCGDCSRIRMSTEGRLYTCLFATQGHDLRTLLRQATPESDERIAARLAALWSQRDDRYSQIRVKRGNLSSPSLSDAHTDFNKDSARSIGPRIEMSYIGG